MRKSVLLILLAVFLPLLLIVMVQQQTVTQHAAETHKITIKDFTMNPTSLTVHAGDTVTWTNQDEDAHDAHSVQEVFASPLLQKGENYSFTFTQPGTYEYYCTPHKGIMKGYTITVLPAVEVPTATPTLTPMLTPTQAPQLPTATPTIAVTPTTKPPVSGATSIAVILALHGIGSAGDTTNPNTSEISNTSPKQPTRPMSLILIDSTGKTAYAPAGTVNYSSDTGDFRGTIDLGTNFVTGTYTVKVKMPKYLVKRIATNMMITNSAINTLPAGQLVTGDIDSNNALDINDYNSVLTCLDKQHTQNNCQPKRKQEVDLNDDGAITIDDNNLFLREFSVKSGD